MDKREYKPLTIPRVEWNKKTLSNKFGEVVAQPLEPGLGTTFGSAIRRVLLGAIEGAAVTSVIVKGVNNEFSVIPGIVEDTMQLLLNIKQIVVSSKTGQSGTMRLHVTGEKTVTVADIETDEHLELINPEHVLAHVSIDGDLDIQFFVTTGRGYQQAQWPADKPYQEDDRIYLDAMFAPVRNVIFLVEKTRVGKDIDYDKLTLQIQTDGSETPIDVFNYAVSVIRTQLEHFLVAEEIPFNDIVVIPVNEKETKQPALDQLGLSRAAIELLLKPIDELELSVRSHNCLLQAGIKRVIELVNVSEDDALKIKNFGRKSLNEVRDNMGSYGLYFGMNIDEKEVEQLLQAQEQ